MARGAKLIIFIKILSLIFNFYFSCFAFPLFSFSSFPSLINKPCPEDDFLLHPEDPEVMVELARRADRKEKQLSRLEAGATQTRKRRRESEEDSVEDLSNPKCDFSTWSWQKSVARLSLLISHRLAQAISAGP